ncbi:MAG: hypothetical protein WC683_02215 [bacterium]
MAPPEPLETTVAKHSVILAAHGRELKEIKEGLQGVRDSGGEITEMFGKIMAATTHAADGVIALNSTLTSHTQQVDRRFTEMKLDQDRVCSLKHGGIEQRLGAVEQGKTDITKKLEDMSENSKVFYIRDLESKLGAAHASQMVLKTQKFEWSKARFTAVVGLAMLIVGSVATYAVNVAVARTTSKPVPAASASK